VSGTPFHQHPPDRVRASDVLERCRRDSGTHGKCDLAAVLHTPSSDQCLLSPTRAVSLA
jgi:hypothetical protein